MPTHPVPVGLTPALTPNCGTKSTGTSLLTGTDETVAARSAAAERAAVANFMMKDLRAIEDEVRMCEQ